jgi:hypothetical protein
MTDDDDEDDGYVFLSDEVDDDPDAPAPTNVLMVPGYASSSQAVNEMETFYRMTPNKPPVPFISEDGQVENPGTMAASMGISAVGLTEERVDSWLLEQWVNDIL